MNIQFIVKNDAEGYYNGKAYKGLVVATLGKSKSYAHTYLPDSFNECKGKAMASYRLHMKLSRKREVELKNEFRHADKLVCMLMDRMEVLSNRIGKETGKQANLSESLQYAIDTL